MPRGGFRAGSGRKATNPKTIAKKAAKAGQAKPDIKKARLAAQTSPVGKVVPAPAPPPPVEASTGDSGQKSFKTPLEYWEHILADPGASASAKHSAAFAMAPYVHPKLAPAGKKQARQAAADGAGKTSRFGATAPPRLAAAGGIAV